MKFRSYIFLGLALTVFAALVMYQVFFTDKIQPLTKTWERAVPLQKIPTGLVSLKAEDCGTCHVEHYNEWKYSTHALAWKDLQFQAELKKESSPFMCINCHIPLQNQQEYLVSGLINGDIYRPVKTKNQHFDRELQQEGINCASCHVRDGYVIGPNGNQAAPHPVKRDTQHLSENLCISCHNANATITPTLACTFQTGDEWKAGPYFTQKNCISCHMAEDHRPLAIGQEAKKAHFHGFPGSGIPKFDSLPAHELYGLQILPKVSGNVFSVSLKNAHAGHRLPTGDPERFYTIKFILFSANGKKIDSSVNRIGEQWQWYPVAKKISDNNLNINEERTYSYQNNGHKSGHVECIVTKHRMTPETAQYSKLGKNYPLSKVIFSKKWTI